MPRNIYILILWLVLLAGCQSQRMTSPAFTDFEVLWQRADSLEQLALPRSGLAVADTILLQSRQQQSTNDYIKGLLYRIRMNEQLFDDATERNIRELEAEVEALWVPARQLTHSILGDLYRTYYQQNRWRLLEEGAAVSGSSRWSDWTAQELAGKARQHYRLSLSDKAVLASEPSENYRPLLLEGEEKLYLRPSLYDLLVERTLRVFLGEQLYELPGAEGVDWTQEALLQDRERFLAMDLAEGDSLSLQAEALTLLQEWLQYRQHEASTELWCDVDLLRLELLYPLYQGDKGEALYEQGLLQLGDEVAGSPAQARVLFHRALFYQTRAYQSEEDQRNWLGEAHALALQIQEDFPETEAARLAHSLQTVLEQGGLELETPGVLPWGQPLDYQVSYVNVDSLHVALYALEQPDIADFREPGEAWLLRQLEGGTPKLKQTIDLPHYDDFKQHTAALRLGETLPYGLYALVVSDSLFSAHSPRKSMLFRYALIQVSDMTVLQMSYGDSLLLALRDRLSGAGLGPVKVGAYETKMGAGPLVVETSAAGDVVLPLKGTGGRQMRFFLEKGADRFFTRPLWISGSYKQPLRVAQRDFVLTDRAVYRPGQRVHYKIIAMERDTLGLSRVLADERREVVLYDVNHRELSRHSLSTNTYGSASGSFVLPQGELNGDFMLRTSRGATSVLVEAVKRPRFQVKVLPLEGQARLGERVRLTLRAELLNGLPLAGAEVAWRVQRGQQYWRLPRAQQPLAAGKGLTDAEGQLEISVETSAEASQSFGFGSVFIVEADVTAPGGETHSGSGSFELGQKGGRLSLQLQDRFVAEDLKKLPLRVDLQNLSGQDLEGRVAYSIEALKVAAPDYRVEADTFLYDLPEPLPREVVLDRVSRGSMEVKGRWMQELNLHKALGEGYYRFTASWVDAWGDTLRVEDRFTVLHPKSNRYKLSEVLSLVHVGDDQLLPGQELHLRLASVYPGVQAQVLVQLAGEILYNKPLALNGKWENLRLPLPAGRTGSLSVQVLLPHHNRIASQQLSLEVEAVSEQLELSLTAPEDPLLPGSPQTWQVKLRDAQGQPVSAEVTALLYDVALDAYRGHSLPVLNFPPPYQPFLRWDSHAGFFAYSGGRSLPYRQLAFEQPYPAFMWTHTKDFTFGRGSLLKSAGSFAVLNIADDEVAFAEDREMFGAVEEEMIPITRQEEVAPQAPPPPPGTATPIRSNLRETAFFLPHLETDEKGEAVFDFTLPEALTGWRFLALAHTRDGRSVGMEALRVTRKDLMVLPQWPRILREGDEVFFSARILNNSRHQLGGMAHITVRDALSGQTLPMPGLDALSWEAEAGEAVLVDWRVKVPEGLRGLELVLSATSGQLHDGEQQVVAVLPARTLLTDTRPYFFTRAGAYTLELPALLEGAGQRFERFTVTYTENAAWEVLGALPWLQEQAYDNADQAFNRYFAASMARQIFKQHPQIERVLKAWASLPPEEHSVWETALERQPELKTALLSATPWLREAESDAERRRRLAALVSEGALDRERYEALQRLETLQLSSGAWPWFQGMSASAGITSQIVEGFAYLERMGADAGEARELVDRARQWLLSELADHKRRAEAALKQGADWDEEGDFFLAPQVVRQVHALSGVEVLLGDSTLLYWVDRLEAYPPRENMALMARSLQVMHRFGRSAAVERQQAALQEHLLVGEGTYYYKLPSGPYWYQAPVETQVAALEALREVRAPAEVLAGMENWLIQQKRTQHWGSTRATVAAVYALASSERPLFTSDHKDVLKVAGKEIPFESSASGSGFRSFSLQGPAIMPAYGRIGLDKTSDSPSYAAMMVSRFSADSLVEAGGFLTVERQLLKRVLIGAREQWLPVGDSLEVTPGDRLMVRVVVESPHALDFVHLHLPRASLLEPAKPLSGYRYAQGLGYYLSLTDAGADVFIDHLPRGRFSLSFELNAAMQGRASEGPARVQCFYAPEFAGFSKGGTINVKKGDR